MGDRKVKEPGKVNLSLHALLFPGPWTDCEHGRTLETAHSPVGACRLQKINYFCSSLLNLNNYKLKQYLGFFQPCGAVPISSRSFFLFLKKSQYLLWSLDTIFTMWALIRHQYCCFQNRHLLSAKQHCIWNNLIYYLNRILTLDKYKLKFNSTDTNLSPVLWI